jgi:hypothetical protein
MTMATSINRTAVLWIAVGLAALLWSPIPASAGVFGVSAPCSFLKFNRLQCNFPLLSGQTARIQYVSMQCGSTGTTVFFGNYALDVPTESLYK